MAKDIVIMFSAIALFISGCDMGNNTTVNSTTATPTVKIVGAMRNVMHKGELFGTISLDTISNKTHLYGLGPIEYLQGEILIVDGKSFISKVATDSSMTVTETDKVKAPFFVYANIDRWKEVSLPDSVTSIQQLETYLDAATRNNKRPFAFRITARVDSADIHIVNLPAGTEVHSPEEAHQNQKTFSVTNKSVELIGFFSTEHAGVFTHHDTYVHIHLITADKTQLGHVDALTLTKGTAKLFLHDDNK
jgi:acetolactate decarboxylase